jgi:glycosyltransferase involved in cell wall biosynthesis
MIYIFWQNILSIHQSSFIRNLADTNKVILVAEKDIDRERITHGWNIPNFGKATVLSKIKKSEILTLLENHNAVHIFTGISSFPMVYYVFKMAVKNNCKIMVQLEPYNFIDSKAWLRWLKYSILRLKYGKKIDAILAIGSAATECYVNAGFSKNKIFSWGYFVENNATIKQKNSSKGIKLLYVGSIDNRKNILGILPIIHKHIDKFERFTIIGKGPRDEELHKFAVNDKIIYKGSVANSEISNYYFDSDILILPSLFDGWGAVVNEALMAGTKVLCSKTCGASELISSNRGRIFTYKKNDFETQFLRILEDGVVTQNLRREIVQWSERSISGEVASKYFLQIVNHLYNSESKPSAPWL